MRTVLNVEGGGGRRGGALADPERMESDRVKKREGKRHTTVNEVVHMK